MSKKDFYSLGEDNEPLDTSVDYVSQMCRSRRRTFTIRVPLAIANTIDALVDADDTLQSGDV